jgi:hypothetical protein
MKTRRSFLGKLAFALPCLLLPQSALRALDPNASIEWMSYDEVAKAVRELAPTRFLSDVEVRNADGKAQFRLKWIEPTGKYFDLRILTSRPDLVDNFKKTRRAEGWTLVKELESSVDAGKVWVGLWHK